MNIADMGLACNYCWHLIKPGEKYTSFRIPGQKDSDAPLEYEHYHNRLRSDCYDKKRKELEKEIVLSLPMESAGSGTQQSIGFDSRRGQP
ncbi:MAG: hypothetical protein HY647_02385 [Acidobacteria bacterium]|nr:hypothetical protein [Acidobacteriota bacterium]